MEEETSLIQIYHKVKKNDTSFFETDIRGDGITIPSFLLLQCDGKGLVLGGGSIVSSKISSVKTELHEDTFFCTPQFYPGLTLSMVSKEMISTLRLWDLSQLSSGTQERSFLLFMFFISFNSPPKVAILPLLLTDWHGFFLSYFYTYNSIILL